MTNKLLTDTTVSIEDRFEYALILIEMKNNRIQKLEQQIAILKSDADYFKYEKITENWR
jgi:hypothetical protein